MQMIDKTISTLLAENSAHGRVLQRLGVDFEMYYHQTLFEVCRVFKWNQTAILKALELEKVNAKLTYEELEKHSLGPVSYTHLTLPTILLV